MSQGGGSAKARPGKRKGPRKQHRLMRAWNQVHGVLGPVLSIAAAVVVGLMAVSVVVIDLTEKGHNPQVTSLWSAVKWVALSLLGSPPFRVVTPGGRVIQFVVDLLKPSTVALLSAAAVSHLFGYLVKRTSGMGRTRLKDHIVICGWSGKGSEIIKEIRGRGDSESQRPIVVVATLNTNPSRDELTTFVHGDPTETEDLRRAGIERAKTAIVLADNSIQGLDLEETDSRTLLTTLAIEAINPKCYTCVEVVHSKNREHFDRTKADELVVSAHLTGALLAHSAVTRGLSQVVGDLLTFPGGDEFFWIPVPTNMSGAPFQEALARLKDKADCILVAIASAGKGYETNPPSDRPLADGDRLLVIAKREPVL
jgi:voltage-gated potassium channel